MAKAQERKTPRRKAADASVRIVLSRVVQYDDPGQLSVPNQLDLGNDGKLYLTRSSATVVRSGKGGLLSQNRILRADFTGQ